MINLIWLAKQSVIHVSMTDEANSPGLLLKDRLHNETLPGHVTYLRIIRDVSLTMTPQVIIWRNHGLLCSEETQHILTESHNSWFQMSLMKLQHFELTSLLLLDSDWHP